MKRFHPLSSEEEEIIHNKKTEKPGSGLFYRWKQKGIFLCKRCDAPLYLSEYKLDSDCGWPSFDEEIHGAILKTRDSDGSRIEICCSRCQAHLGHFFVEEQLTSKNVRHCVNSSSLSFLPSRTEEGFDIAFFAGGCFWGVEYVFQKEKGVLQTSVGYMGGEVVDPTYEEVSAGNTGQRETVKVVFDSNVITFESLVKIFFEIHDSTQKTGQGPDLGSQYMSTIFFLTEEQRKIAQRCINYLQKKGMDVVTQILPASHFYPAEKYHQKYYQKTGELPYCYVRTKRF
jgi:peptide methionine sulfoxide reductase msrA/msrB